MCTVEQKPTIKWKWHTHGDVWEDLEGAAKLREEIAQMCMCVFSCLKDMMVGGIVTLLWSSFGNSAWCEKAWLGVKWQGVDLWRLILIVSLMNWAPPLGGSMRVSLRRNYRADSCPEPVLPSEKWPRYEEVWTKKTNKSNVAYFLAFASCSWVYLSSTDISLRVFWLLK